jgi:hypothetical protein
MTEIAQSEVLGDNALEQRFDRMRLDVQSEDGTESVARIALKNLGKFGVDEIFTLAIEAMISGHERELLKTG